MHHDKFKVELNHGFIYDKDMNLIGETDGEIREFEITDEEEYHRRRTIIGRDENNQPIIVEVCE